MKDLRKTKIIATIGPASCTKEKIEELFQAGVNVFRLNFSHGTHEEHQKVYDNIRSLENEHNIPIGILMDLQGPKLRVGTFKDTLISLQQGQSFRLDLDHTPGDHYRVCLPHPEIFAALQPGTRLLLDDGKLHLKVTECSAEHALTEVLVSGHLSNRKGVNVPDVPLDISSLTAKDRKDLDFGLSLGVDWVALSFVQKPQDILEARDIIQDKAKIAAKIEKPTAIQYLKEIVDLSDAIMVARGDLGVEMPPEEVPVLQKKIIQQARDSGKPVIVATQMLESMIQSPSPTRAEASDVATAVFDGADAVMLSAESASGKYPVEAIQIMVKIIHVVEKAMVERPTPADSSFTIQSTPLDALSVAIKHINQIITVSAIAVYTITGNTALRIARQRPLSKIMALTPEVKTARQLTLAWGIDSFLTPLLENFQDMHDRSCALIVQKKFAERGDHMVTIAGIPFQTAGEANLLNIIKIPSSKTLK
jgi:pyruvate kinase